jgi:hypothetical protein
MEMGVDWGATIEIWPSDVDATARTYIQTTLKANQALGLTEDNDPNDLIGRPNGRKCLKTNAHRTVFGLEALSDAQRSTVAAL